MTRIGKPEDEDPAASPRSDVLLQPMKSKEPKDKKTTKQRGPNEQRKNNRETHPETKPETESETRSETFSETRPETKTDVEIINTK
ncbi:MAG: hypothetical protein K2N04_00520 [Alistipes sp.]|nr:hypothetical protein [Alistipes sp.]